ncbi:Sucrose transport protein SUC3 [Porphyridium purpureum]|uniref:Sucrose transport protein SUC3 n=1 Tax=Porphyridium purpureum TaxID=35688 RepID=A0A5J4YYG0_PORPP|nr:Sucrose transport protein SUC3 [Porphyridium purpureum]|eukprot:POR2728..scf209_3
MSGRAEQGLPQWRLLMLTVAMCGVQICYAVQIGHGTPQLEVLGMGTQYVSLAWLAGPLSGLIMQPLIGVLSDRCVSPLGKRRPFLIIGCVLSSLALIMFSNAAQLGRACATALGGSLTAWSIFFGIMGFFFLDFSVNAIQGPLRALLTDVTPEAQQATGNAYFAFMVGLGNLLGSYLGSLDFRSMGWTFFQENIQILFFLAMLLLDLTIVLCVVFTSEAPNRVAEQANRREQIDIDEKARLLGEGNMNDEHVLGDRETEHSFEEDDVEFDDLGSTLSIVMYEAPVPYWQVFAVQFCAWFGFFSIMVYAVDWVALNVFRGVSSAPRGTTERMLYEKGVRVGNIGLSMCALVTIVYAAALPKLVRRLGLRQVYFISQAVEGIGLCLPLFLRGSPGVMPSLGLQIAAVSTIGLMGIFMASAMTIPWSLMGVAVQRMYPDKVGVFSALFNACQAGPQLIVALISPLILRVAADVSVIMFMGGMSAFLGAYLVLHHGIGVDEFYQ